MFLDIDGVLNAHDYDGAAKSCTIRPECVRAFNRILGATDARIVLSSAWRYMILGGAMTLRGFEYLLRTHGVRCDGLLIGLTERDELVPTRGKQIGSWLHSYAPGSRRPARYLVLDDGGTDPVTGEWDDMGISSAEHPVLWTDGKVGLTEADAGRAIAMLWDAEPLATGVADGSPAGGRDAEETRR